jgi:hypothetical protein
MLTSSDSIELLAFNLCFLEMSTIAPLPMDMMVPVCSLLVSQWAHIDALKT